MQLGIDVGGSLTKVVLVDERDNQYFTFEPQQDEGLDQLLEQYPNTPIAPQAAAHRYFKLSTPTG